MKERSSYCEYQSNSKRDPEFTIPGLDQIKGCNPDLVAELISKQNVLVQYIASMGKFVWDSIDERFVFRVNNKYLKYGKNASKLSNRNILATICNPDAMHICGIKVKLYRTENIGDISKVVTEKICYTMKYNMPTDIIITGSTDDSTDTNVINQRPAKFEFPTSKDI